MVVFVCGAQLLFEQCDCAVPVRARYREGVRILLSCTSWTPDGHLLSVVSALWREASPPRPGGCAQML